MIVITATVTINSTITIASIIIITTIVMIITATVTIVTVMFNFPVTTYRRPCSGETARHSHGSDATCGSEFRV